SCERLAPRSHSYPPISLGEIVFQTLSSFVLKYPTLFSISVLSGVHEVGHSFLSFSILSPSSSRIMCSSFTSGTTFSLSPVDSLSNFLTTSYTLAFHPVSSIVKLLQ